MTDLAAPDPGFIARALALPRGQDYAYLRARGLQYIERLAHANWTDYNVHDPGVTILELLCYAITDLGLRAAYPMRDLLAPLPQGGPTPAGDFHLANEVLVCKPVLFDDLRRLLIDIEGVRNAWVERHREIKYALDVPHDRLTADPAGDSIELNGLFNVYLEYEDFDAHPRYRMTKHEVRAAAIERIHANRNLCEDVINVCDLAEEEVAVCADIELRADADTNAVHAEILYRLYRFISPTVPFHSFDELLARGRTVDEIFDGPPLDHGFIDGDELKALRRKCEIHASDVVQILMQVDGVVAVKSLKLLKVGDPAHLEDWILPLSAARIAVFAPWNSKLTFYKRGLPYLTNRKTVEPLYTRKKAADVEEKLKVKRRELTAPAGEWRNVGGYEPVVNELPLTYRVGRIQVPARDPVRQAQSRQLTAYLLFFDQLLANYLAQLSHVGDLFTWRDVGFRTYFTQQIAGIFGLEPVVQEDGSTAPGALDRSGEGGYATFNEALEAIVEAPALADRRRLRFLEHLVARYAEEFDEYKALVRPMLRAAFDLLAPWTPGTVYAVGAHVAHDAVEYVCLKAHAATATRPPRAIPDTWRQSSPLITQLRRLLEDYPRLSAGRGTGFDWRAPFLPTNVAGYQRRVYRLLDIDPVVRTRLAGHRFEIADSGTAGNPAWRFELKDEGGSVIFQSIPCASKASIEALLDLALRLGGDAANYDRDPTDGRPRLVQVCAGDAPPSPLGHAVGANVLPGVIAYFKTYAAPEGFHVIEHILLRRRTLADPFLPVQIEAPDECCPTVRDPYSFRVSIVLPSWSPRFRDMKFRRFVEDTLRREAPAHVYPRICWVNHEQMKDLEIALENWQAGLAALAREPSDCSGKDGSRTGRLPLPLANATYAATLGALVDILYRLVNVYPPAQLHDCQEVDGDAPQVTLGNTSLGTL